jgi:PAS domain S-box-containing protein
MESLSDDKFRQVFELASDALFLIAKDTGQILDCNRMASTLYGYERNELLAMKNADLSAEPEETLRLMNEMPPVTDRPWVTPQRYHRAKGGKVFPVEITVQTFALDGRHVGLASCRDIYERVKAEKALRESESKWKALYSTMPVGVSILDDQGNLVEFNPMLGQILGIDAEGLRQGRYRQCTYLHADGTPMSSEEFPSVLAVNEQRTVRNVEIGVRKEDGQVVWTRVSAAPLNLPGISCIISTTDITERKRAEQNLRTSQAFLDNIIECSPNALWISDEFGTLLRMNQSCRETLHLRDEEVVGKYNIRRDNCLEEQGFMPLIHDVFERGIAARFVAHYDTAAVKDLQLEHTTKLVLDVGISPILDAQGKVANAIIQHVDITERRRADEALKLSEFKLRAILDNSYDAIGVHINGIWEVCNPAALRLFGVSTPEQLIGRSILEVIAPGERTRIGTFVRNRMESADASLTYVTRGLRADGTEFDMDVSLSSFTLAGRRHVLVILRDITARKRAEETLRDSEEQLEKIFNSSTNGLSFTEPVDGKILNVNDTWVRDMGISRSDAIGKTALELSVWANRDERDAYLAALERDGGLREFEATMMVRGVERQFALNAEFVDLRRGRFLLWELRDITEGKRAEEALRRYELLARCSRDIVLFVRSDDGRILEANVAALRAYGYTREELLSHAIGDLRASDTRALLEEQMDASDSLGLQFETVHQRKDGSTFSVEVSCVGATLGGVRTLMSVVRDITERKQKENEFRESESRFRTLTEDSPLAIVVTRGVVTVYVNQMFQKVFALPNTEALIGRSILECVAPHCRDAIFERTRRRAAGLPVDAEFETTAVRPDGTQFPVHVTAAIVQLPDGQATLFFITDLTPRKQAEEENAKLQEQLAHAQKMESIGRLAGGVAHDFNNMLGVILGHCELALEKVDPVDSLHGDLLSIRTSAQRSADLTRQLLAFARKQTVSPKELNLNDTVAGMLKMVRRLIGEDIKLEWRPGENVWPVMIDPTQVDQILANLCVNARDAIANVGTITIETGNVVFAADVSATLSGALPGDYVWLRVSDDGCGMDQTTQSHIFEPFFTTKEVGKGTGLGLATVYGIIKQNSGFIDLRSEVGRGTAFVIHLPKHVGKTANEPTEMAVQPARPGQETILLVEDEAPLLDITQRMLERRGYKILAASTPGQALQIGREHTGKIDLLITDVVMPEMNGRDLAKGILSIYPQTKCLFMSGFTADVIAHHGVIDEGIFFIQKPFSAKDLAATVRAVLDSGSTDKG